MEMILLRVSEEEINKLMKDKMVIIDDVIETCCEICSEEISIEIQLVKKREK